MLSRGDGRRSASAWRSERRQREWSASVLSRVAWLVGTGVLAGVTISLWTTQFVGTLLYGLQPRDPMTLAGATVMLAAVGLLAGWLPAWRASRIDPAEVLRAF